MSPGLIYSSSLFLFFWFHYLWIRKFWADWIRWRLYYIRYCRGLRHILFWRPFVFHAIWSDTTAVQIIIFMSIRIESCFNNRIIILLRLIPFLLKWPSICSATYFRNFKAFKTEATSKQGLSSFHCRLIWGRPWLWFL